MSTKGGLFKVEVASTGFLLFLSYSKRITHLRPTVVVFLYVKGALDAMDQVVLFSEPRLKDMLQKFVNFLRALLSHTHSRLRVCDELSSSIEAMSGAQQKIPVPTFLFKFIVDEAVEYF